MRTRRIARWLLVATLLSHGCGDDEAAPRTAAPSTTTRAGEEEAAATPEPAPAPTPRTPPPWGDTPWAGAERGRYVLRGVGREAISDFAITPDSRHVAVGAYDGTLSVVDAATGAVLASTRAEAEGPIRFRLTIRGDSVLARYTTLYGSGGDATLLWRWREGRIVYREGGMASCDLSPDGERFVCDEYPSFIADARTGERHPIGPDDEPVLDPPRWVHAERLLTTRTRGHHTLTDLHGEPLRELTGEPYAIGADVLVFCDGADVTFVASADGHELARAVHGLHEPTRLSLSSSGALAALSNGTESVLIHRDDGRVEPLAYDVVGVTDEIAIIETADGSWRRLVLEGRRLGMRMAPPPVESYWEDEFVTPPTHARMAPNGSVVVATGGQPLPSGAGSAAGSVRVVSPTGTTPIARAGTGLDVRRGFVGPDGNRALISLFGARSLWLDGAGARISTCDVDAFYPVVDFEQRLILGSDACSPGTDERRRLFSRPHEVGVAVSDDLRFVLSDRGTILDRRTATTTLGAPPPDLCDAGFHDDTGCGGTVTFGPEARFIWAIGFAIYESSAPTMLLAAGQREPLRTFEDERSGVFSRDGRFVVHAGPRTVALLPLDGGDERWLAGSAPRLSPGRAPLALSPDDATVAWSANGSRTVRLLSTADAADAGLEVDDQVSRLRFSPSGHQLLIDTATSLQLHDRRTGVTTRLGTRTGYDRSTHEIMTVYCLESRVRVLRETDDGDFELLDLGRCEANEPLPRLEGRARFLVFVDGPVTRLRRLANGDEIYVVVFSDPDGDHWLVHDTRGRYQSDGEGVPAWIGLRADDGSVGPLRASDRDDGLLRRFFGGGIVPTQTRDQSTTVPVQ